MGEREWANASGRTRLGIQLLADGPSVALVWRGVAWVADVWVRLEVVCGGGMLDNGWWCAVNLTSMLDSADLIPGVKGGANAGAKRGERGATSGEIGRNRGRGERVHRRTRGH